LQLLGQWPQPSGRDAVVGLWRPLSRRDASALTGLVAAKFALLARQPTEVQAAAARMAGQLGVKEIAASLYALVQAVVVAPEARVEALKALAALKDDRLLEALKVAQGDSNETLRKEAARLQAQVRPGDAIEQLRRALDRGTLSEQQSALATLAGLKEKPADEIINRWLDKLLAGRVRAELVLDVIEAGKQRTAADIASKLRAYEERRDPQDHLRSYRECVTGGNAEEGRKIFYERAEVSCVRCHKINGEGGEVGPDLTGYGGKKDRGYILEAITYPNAQIAEGFESVIVTLNNGTSYAGTVKSETATELEINSPEDGLVKVKHADIKERGRGLSAMPEELRQVLTKPDLRNLVEFLSSLK
jgi:quinoprotein glucose dehydrogenase